MDKNNYLGYISPLEELFRGRAWLAAQRKRKSRELRANINVNDLLDVAFEILQMSHEQQDKWIQGINARRVT